jgi:hypothetical protein
VNDAENSQYRGWVSKPRYFTSVLLLITLLQFGVVKHSAELLMGVYYSDNAKITSLVVV